MAEKYHSERGARRVIITRCVIIYDCGAHTTRALKWVLNITTDYYRAGVSYVESRPACTQCVVTRSTGGRASFRWDRSNAVLVRNALLLRYGGRRALLRAGAYGPIGREEEKLKMNSSAQGRIQHVCLRSGHFIGEVERYRTDRSRM